MIDKLVANAAEAIHDLPDGATIMMGGFGLCGIPEKLILALKERGARGLTVISNNAGTTDHGISHLLRARQVKKMISTYVGENEIFEQQVLSHQLEVELVPQGTFAERIRAGGAGLGGFYTPTGFGTPVAENKESRVIGGKNYLLEMPLTADYAFIRAWKGDRLGNLVFRKTARNFNPIMATAGRVTIAEVEEFVEPGHLDPENVHTPGIYVQRILQGGPYQKRIERLTTRSPAESSEEP